jgi:hypothetical protein
VCESFPFCSPSPQEHIDVDNRFQIGVDSRWSRARPRGHEYSIAKVFFAFSLGNLFSDSQATADEAAAAVASGVADGVAQAYR